ncbi:MAG: undecaprenyldiphospho-muramoylpentapeptide beta-N-acetylglucosaminyltransferase [Candidatus Omnitrophica bacterium]|nr:undecaprenyldiphospho-muramoylpentapeptide beta-N-acetylglucosaminyltransferase [Candidatus Omnitrophota bacterium]
MRILLACGGTGGHLFPAMGLIPTLKGKHDLFFVTGMSRLEEELLPETLGNVARIPSRKLPNWKNWGSFLMDTSAAVKRSFHFLRKFRPDVVVGFGGYASVPVLIAARCRGIPVVLHEQNIIPGKTNRLFSRWAKGVAVSFPQALSLWNFHPKVRITGNPGPLRWERTAEHQEIFSELGLDSKRITFLVMGGSQGARQINLLMSQAIPQWLKQHPEQQEKIQLIHLTGEADFNGMRQAFQKLPIPALIAPFYQEMHRLYQASQLVVARAGATTLAELAHFRLPSILIPYPYAGAHQFENAKIFEEEAAAIVLKEKSITVSETVNLLQSLTTSKNKLQRMRLASARLAIVDSADRFLDLIEEVVQK